MSLHAVFDLVLIVKLRIHIQLGICNVAGGSIHTKRVLFVTLDESSKRAASTS